MPYLRLRLRNVTFHRKRTRPGLGRGSSYRSICPPMILFKTKVLKIVRLRAHQATAVPSILESLCLKPLGAMLTLLNTQLEKRYRVLFLVSVPLPGILLINEDDSLCSLVQASSEQLREVEPRSQSPAANSETFAKRNGSIEDLDEADNVERDLESSSYSLDVGGGLQGRPSSNSDNSVQCKVDLRNVQTRKGKSKPAAQENMSGFGSDILNSVPLGSALKKPAKMALEEPPDSPTSLALGSAPRQPAKMALEELPDSAEFFAGLQGGRATTSSQVLVEDMEEREEGQRMSSVWEEDSSAVDLHQDT